jgi:urate oxidase
LRPVSPTLLDLAQINALSPEVFIQVFGSVLEHSAHYAQAVVGTRPFASVGELVSAFDAAVAASDEASQLALIRAHPDLAGKAALAGELSPESALEQASAGLDHLSADEFQTFHQLNQAYRDAFGLPYVVCVREHDKAGIFAGLRTRLQHTPDQERAEALRQISRIARLRLLDLVADGPLPGDSLPGGPMTMPEKTIEPKKTTEPEKTTQPSLPAVRVRLGANNYGKADIRLFKVNRDQPRHTVTDVWVRVALEGDFTAAHVEGDNTGLLATDTLRNTVYALAIDQLQGDIERFGQVLIRHLIAQGPTVERVRISLTEHLWQRLAPGGTEHDHAFVRQMPKHTAQVEGDGTLSSVTSGIEELYLLKTTNSGWEGFLREDYTTLPETDDRILATVVSSHWEYEAGEHDYSDVWQRVYTTLQSTFTDHYSPSMQATLYRIGEAVLGQCPEISRIFFAFPNRHHIRYTTERFGIPNPNTVFHADAEPYGQIEGWVERM